MLTPKTRTSGMSLFVMLLAAASLSGQNLQKQSGASRNNTATAPSKPDSSKNACPLEACLAGGKDADSNIDERNAMAWHVAADKAITLYALRGSRSIPEAKYQGASVAVRELLARNEDQMKGAALESKSRVMLTLHSRHQDTPPSESVPGGQIINLRAADNEARFTHERLKLTDKPALTFTLGKEAEEFKLKFSPATRGTHYYLVVLTGVAGKGNARRPMQAAGLFIVDK